MSASEPAASRPKRRDRWRLVVAWAVVAPFAAWALLRVLGLERGFPLVALVAFTPYVAAASLVALAAAAIMRVRGAVLLAAVVAVALLALVVPRAVPGGQTDQPENGAELTVMTANLHFGEADPAAVVAAVREAEVDLLCLQEVTPAAVRGLRRAGLEGKLDESVVSTTRGAGGGAIYARLPLTATGDVHRAAGFRMPGARLRVSGRPVAVASVHPVPPTDAESTRRWRDALRALPGAGDGAELGLLLGDFNATLDHSELRRVLDSGYVDAADVTGAGLVPTWSRGLSPPLTIDHLLVDERIHIADSEVRALPGSDHRAVIADLVAPIGRVLHRGGG
jgi:endonuclease/exonuclease/phosphatase family metal-dependent hydrolase